MSARTAAVRAAWGLLMAWSFATGAVAVHERHGAGMAVVLAIIVVALVAGRVHVQIEEDEDVARAQRRPPAHARRRRRRPATRHHVDRVRRSIRR